MPNTVFITGTDTEVGKTYVACGIARAARMAGLRVAVFKPVAAGSDYTDQGLRNSDALALMHAAQTDADYAVVNPYCFSEPVAPHLAAADAGVNVDIGHIVDCYQSLARKSDLVIVEGAGGWAVPLSERFAFPDLVQRCQWPVLLVVGMRLGCLNHALLSAESIARRARLLGWVANCLPPQQPRLEENIASLRTRLTVPCLGRVTGHTPAEQGLCFDELYQAM